MGQLVNAFSLVEVVLALGVVAFAFVGILALLPAGMGQFRQAMDTTVCAQIAQRVISDAQQTDYEILVDLKNLPEPAGGGEFTFRAPKVREPALRYFDDQANEVVPKSPKTLSAEEKARVIYHVNVRVMPQANVRAMPHNSAAGSSDKDSRRIATVTIQVAGNPGNRDIPISNARPDDDSSPDRNLFQKTPGVSILTYSALIGRNQ